MHSNIASYLLERAKKNPHQRAIIITKGRDRDGRMIHTHMTYHELNLKSDFVAKGLLALGFKKGERVVLMTPPSFELFILTFGLFKAGLVPIFVDPGLGVKNLKKCLHNAKPHHFIGIPKAHIARILLGWNRGQWNRIVTVGSPSLWGITLDTLIQKGKESTESYPLTLAGDEAAILFTSGSTGFPKGAVYSHKNFINQVEILRTELNIKDGEIDLCTFPLFALFAPAFGMTAVVPEMDFTKPARVNPENIFLAIETFGVQNMFGSPALMRTVGIKAAAESKQFSSLKRVISAGAPVSAAIIKTFKSCLPENAKFYTPYGATEALPVAIAESKTILSETNRLTLNGAGVCIGKPVGQSEVKIIRISDDPITDWTETLSLPQGQIGEICVRGPQVTKSYFNQHEATSLAKIWIGKEGNCYHRMGDLGYFDDQGRLWFCGRKSHRVIAKQSQTIFTVPGESIVNSHDDIERSAIVGVGTGRDRRPVLCLQAKPHVSKRDQIRIREQVAQLCARHSETKDIKEILFHKSFPVDIRHNSKIFREKLSAWAEERL